MHAIQVSNSLTDMVFAVIATVMWCCVLQYVVNQDEHKIPVEVLVKRLETSLNNVSMTFWMECDCLVRLTNEMWCS